MRSPNILDVNSPRVLHRGRVLLRIVFYAKMAPFKGMPTPPGRSAGHKVVMAEANSPTHAQAAEWACWAASKYNRGTTHLSPETYEVFTYDDPFFGRITAIDIGMGS